MAHRCLRWDRFIIWIKKCSRKYQSVEGDVLRLESRMLHYVIPRYLLWSDRSEWRFALAVWWQSYSDTMSQNGQIGPKNGNHFQAHLLKFTQPFVSQVDFGWALKVTHTNVRANWPVSRFALKFAWIELIRRWWRDKTSPLLTCAEIPYLGFLSFTLKFRQRAGYICLHSLFIKPICCTSSVWRMWCTYAQIDPDRYHIICSKLKMRLALNDSESDFSSLTI